MRLDRWIRNKFGSVPQGLIEKNQVETKEGLSELKKIIIWASSTLFATMLLALLTSVFGGL